MESYDLVVIGAGWAGIRAAKLAKKHGLRTALVERGAVGGTCLHLGCIPTKSLLASAKRFKGLDSFHIFGIDLHHTASIDAGRIQQRKNAVIGRLSAAIVSQLEGVDILTGTARFTDSHTITVNEISVSSRFFLIATGAAPAELPDLPFDHSRILSSNDILGIAHIPKDLLVVGGGAAGCEFASLFSMFGSKVTICEEKPGLLPGFDEDIAKRLQAGFRKQGITVAVGTAHSDLAVRDFELVLVCAGRRPEIEPLDLKAAGVAVENGFIKTASTMQTSAAHIYAAGDCANPMMLAHLAAWQAESAIAHMMDNSFKAVQPAVARTVYSNPEAAQVGLSPAEARAAGIDVKEYTADFLSVPMARIIEETDGMVKLAADSDNNLIGAGIIGPDAVEIAGTLTLAVNIKMPVSKFKNTVFAHPSLSEIFSGVE
jgi:dihydrolipoamide dehydrogenase